VEKKRLTPSEQLLKGLTEEEREEFARKYKRAKSVLTVINNYAQSRYHEKTKAMDSAAGFNTPNWAYMQAWNAGYRSAMRDTMQVTRIQ
jgi:hypothetical protein